MAFRLQASSAWPRDFNRKGDEWRREARNALPRFPVGRGQIGLIFIYPQIMGESR